MPAGCSTVIVALVKRMSLITSFHRWFGQSGAPGIGLFVGGLVVRPKATFPFLISDAGMASGLAVRVTGAGFWPGGSLSLPFLTDGLTQTAMGLPVAVRLTTRSWFPSPASAPEAVSVSPLSLKVGAEWAPPLRWTLPAYAGAPAPARATPATAAVASSFLKFMSPLRLSPECFKRSPTPHLPQGASRPHR